MVSICSRASVRCAFDVGNFVFVFLEHVEAGLIWIDLSVTLYKGGSNEVSAELIC